MFRRALASALVAVAAIPALAGAALAASKNTPTTPSSITLNQAQPALGMTITFSVVYPTNIKDPRIEVMCYQNGTMVWASSAPVGSGFLLGGSSSPWISNGGGPASCVANLYYYVWNGNNSQYYHLLATTSFSAAG